MKTSNIYNNRALQEANVLFALERVKKFRNPISISPTFIGSSQKAKKEAQERVITLLHKLSKRINRKRYNRNGELIDCVGVVEYDDNTRPNLHLIFDIPENINREEFIRRFEIVIKSVLDLRQGFISENSLKRSPKYMVSEFNSAEQAVKYLMKFKTKDPRNNFTEYVVA
jgi:hypothetical protein